MAQEIGFFNRKKAMKPRMPPGMTILYMLAGQCKGSVAGTDAEGIG
jgi:hypothetical protein